ncbi:lipid-A-disaccharide synthase [Hasllibacter halocynthiae]|uniref:lipid-A-disaccharide synthase n=1 Tax=Hasllibacter halocynthiae TaxID=595589 RepID=UPI000D05CCAC|nr:lipid-A-disaccharide synthase [Hasllibacter halocynthiae]
MKAFLMAGEASGDALGAALLRGLRAEGAQVDARGIAGPLMRAEGMESLFPMDELSVMGLAEVLPRYLDLRRRIHDTARAAIAFGPDVVVGIDSPDFCLRVDRLIRAIRPAQPVAHYVAPSVWAWRPGRAVKMARDVDHVLALLPFEPPYMEAAGMSCDFVGHPVAAEPVASPEVARAFRKAHDLCGRVLAVLPGSRAGEIARMAPVHGAALRPILAAHPELAVVVPVAPGRRAQVEAAVAGWPVRPVLVEGPEARRVAFAAADAALATSGTVSLELARQGCPMVIAYDMAPLTRMILSRMVRVDTVTLVNLVSETRAVPEFIGRNCRPDAIAAAVLSVLADPAAQQAAMALTMERLGADGPDPGRRAARSVLDLLSRR